MKALLASSQLCVITRSADPELGRIQDKIGHKLLVDGRTDLEEVLGRLLDAARDGAHVAPKTLDLIGHSTGGAQLLQLGDWVIDHCTATVTAFFRELADQDVLARLGIRAIRLLGCQTADTDHGRATVTCLSDIVGMEVYGTRELIYSAHYDATGFREECAHVLVCASDLRQADREPATLVTRYPRMLDIDALPATPLAALAPAWPRWVANIDVAGRLLQLVRRAEGAHMPGLLASPACEVAMPSARPGRYHVVQVLLDGDFVRVYPDGADQPGVVYPVSDARALLQLVATLRPVMR